MLGEKVGETSGKVTGRRVLPGDDYRYVKMEITIEETGTILGSDGMNLGTYIVYERVPGQLFGEGQGLIGTSAGDSAIWKGHGVARMTGDGAAMSFRYSLAVQAAPDGKFARLNQVLIIGEHEVDADGNTRTNMFEWK